jgi:hypothetical protein
MVALRPTAAGAEIASLFSSYNNGCVLTNQAGARAKSPAARFAYLFTITHNNRHEKTRIYAKKETERE